jgi:hypothetical protein
MMDEVVWNEDLGDAHGGRFFFVGVRFLSLMLTLMLVIVME